jgi:hypothetical protein
MALEDGADDLLQPAKLTSMTATPVRVIFMASRL